jgi:hypothetical protein
MSIHIGGLDLTDTVVNLEFRMGVLERVMDKVSAFVPAGALTKADLEAIRDQVMKDMQKRYPDLGLTPKKNG